MNRPTAMHSTAICLVFFLLALLIGYGRLPLVGPGWSFAGLGMPAGVAFAVLWRYGRRAAGAFLAGAALAAWALRAAPLAQALCAAGLPLLPLLAVAGQLRRKTGADALTGVHQVIYLAAALLATQILTAALQVAGLVIGGQPAAGLWPAWQQCWLQDGVSLFLLAPPLLLLQPARFQRLAHGAQLEMGLLLAAVAGLGFVGWLLPAATAWPLSFLLLPPVLWAALRFGRQGALVAALLANLAAAAGTLAGHGQWIALGELRALLVLWQFVVVTNLVGLVLAAYLDEQRQETRGSRQLAHYDPLTGLPNRTLLMLRMQAQLRQAQAQGRVLGLMFIDLDRFKTINDSLGHATGDVLLRQVGQRLQQCLHKGDSVARTGSDEFVIVFCRPAGETVARDLAAQVLAAIAVPFQVEGQLLYLTASVGVGLSADAPDVQRLLKHADLALHDAKRAGKNCCRFYAPHLHQRAAERLALENDLRQALERDEFEVVYQPKLDLERNCLAGFEALLRWHRPGHGLVSPGSFIWIAEETGLIRQIGRRVLEIACRQAKDWQEAGFGGIKVAVNLSPRQFHDPLLVEHIAHTLQGMQAAPDLLELELTESAVMDEPAQSGLTLAQLKKMGIRIAIDDFGTGYSSLSYLKHFPIDTLKIDQSFVRDLTRSSQDAAIIDAIISMARSLKLDVIAEGVETAGQFESLRSRGCRVIQGHYLAPALTAREAQAFLDQYACAAG